MSSFFRKAFWPTAIALAVMMLFATMGSGSLSPKSASAEIDGVWAIDGITEEPLGDIGCAGIDDQLDTIGISSIEPGDVINLTVRPSSLSDEALDSVLAGGYGIGLCVEVSSDSQEVGFDSNDYGTFPTALCGDQNNDDVAWEHENDNSGNDDDCGNMVGEGTDDLTVVCAGSDCTDSDDGDGDIIAVFACGTAPGTATVVIDQDGEFGEFTIVCHGLPSTVTLTPLPAAVEIVPALGNVSHSLIIAQVADSTGGTVLDGTLVDFRTDRCGIDALTEDEFDELYPFALGIKKTDPNTHLSFDIAANDSLNGTASGAGMTFTTDLDLSSATNTRSIAAAVLHCDADSVTPGVATITAEIDRPGADLIGTTTVTVVGPPAAVVVTTDKASVTCGERVQVTAKITDAIGQNVSEHTLAESFTNNGGTMGGTGAIAGFAAPITPFSSTVGETFSGIVTFTLITSDVNQGTYEIVVTSGGSGAVGAFWDSNDFVFPGGLGGWFSTPPVSGYAKITCTNEAAPAVSAPATGTGPLRAPNTGDAGLASSSSSWSLFGIAGAVAFALAGLASLKLVTRR